MAKKETVTQEDLFEVLDASVTMILSGLQSLVRRRSLKSFSSPA